MEYRGFDTLKDICIRYMGEHRNRSSQFCLGLDGREKMDKDFAEKTLELNLKIALQTNGVEGVRTQVCGS